MPSITHFDDLPDLVLVELLAYLSSVDIMWGFTRLNHRLTMLISERGFFHRLNLSSARHHQFQTILRFLPLNSIYSFTIDSDASPLQLACWPYLSRLRTLCIMLSHSRILLLELTKDQFRWVTTGFLWTIGEKKRKCMRAVLLSSNEKVKLEWNMSTNKKKPIYSLNLTKNLFFWGNHRKI